MLYIGNFSYSDTNEENDNYCLMPAVVEAANTDEALERFSALLRRLHEESPLLDGAKDIYLDSLVELDKAPEEAVLTQWQKIVAGDEGLFSVVSALPGDEEDAAAFTWDDEDQIEEDEVTLIDDDLDDEDFDEQEIDVEDLAEAITEALDLLLGEDLDFLEDEDLTAPEEAFLSFED